MASCEKCWGDAYVKSRYNGKYQGDNYRELIQINDCTPEEQAGEDAQICPKCKRNVLHQYTKDCMNPECK